jgi:hypothetical protein
MGHARPSYHERKLPPRNGSFQESRDTAGAPLYFWCVDSLFRTELDDIPHLLRWVDASVRSGCMSERTAREWRAKIDAWRQWLEGTSPTIPSGYSPPRA